MKIHKSTWRVASALKNGPSVWLSTMGMLVLRIMDLHIKSYPFGGKISSLGPLWESKHLTLMKLYKKKSQLYFDFCSNSDKCPNGSKNGKVFEEKAILAYQTSISWLAWLGVSKWLLAYKSLCFPLLLHLKRQKNLFWCRGCPQINIYVCNVKNVSKM